MSEVEVSVVMPCLNEAETLAACVKKAQRSLEMNQILGEVIVADNGSTDGSRQIAETLGARLIEVDTKGYGNALMGGIAAARGKYIVMGDADDSYDFSNLLPFIEELRRGFDLVMGNRFLGGIKPGAMPFLHRFLGNPVLTGIGRLFFHSPCGDFQCGLRAFNREAVNGLNLRTTGMEFASEMVVKATLYGLRITEVPTPLSPDGRSRPPHLRTWHDGWRYLRFLLLYSPRWLFLYPGLLLMSVGLLVGLWLLPGSRKVGEITLDVHTLLFAAMSIVIGFQSVVFAVFTKVFAITEKLIPEDPRLTNVFRYVTLEIGLLVGFVFLLVGAIGCGIAFRSWKQGYFGPLDPVLMLRTVIPALTALALGSQILLSSFFLSVLGMGRR